jgi:hypothetical protein
MGCLAFVGLAVFQGCALSCRAKAFPCSITASRSLIRTERRHHTRPQGIQFLKVCHGVLRRPVDSRLNHDNVFKLIDKDHLTPVTTQSNLIRSHQPNVMPVAHARLSGYGHLAQVFTVNFCHFFEPLNGNNLLSIPLALIRQHPPMRAKSREVAPIQQLVRSMFLRSVYQTA